MRSELLLERQSSITSNRGSPAESAFPNISKERALTLTTLLKKLEMQGELSTGKVCDSITKWRSKAREKFTGMLV